MKTNPTLKMLALAMSLATLAACGGAATPAPTAAPPTSAPKPNEAPKPTATALQKVTLQLQWVPQSQFAGYFAAKDKGFYKDEGIDIVIKEGAVDIVPQQVLASGQADFAVSWVPKALVSREEGAKIVNVGQIFQRSGTAQVSWKDSNITKPEDWKGKKVGTWGFGNEFELFAAMTKAGLDPQKDVKIVQQPFDMSLLLNKEIDAAQVEMYNEYAQVLEAKNPKTGKLYQPEDMSVIDMNKVGTAMLQDALWARADWLNDPKNADLATRFLRATMKGWIHCRDNFNECVDIVLKNGPTLGKSHMAWQLNEINRLIWPSPEKGIGVMDKAAWDQTVKISTEQKVLKSAAPADSAYRSDLAEKAAADLKAAGLDVVGKGWQPAKVELVEGGK